MAVTTVAGSQIGVAGIIPAIGEYVQDVTRPNGQTDFLGCNPAIGYTAAEGNEEAFVVGYSCDVNSAAAGTGLGLYPATYKVAIYCSIGVAIVPGNRVDVTAGVATLNNATGAYNVFCTLASPGGFFWAVQR